jgi:hypothetical protein
MSLLGVSAVRCAQGHHQWVTDDGRRQPGARLEHCRGCGARGVWTSASDFLRDFE